MNDLEPHKPTLPDQTEQVIQFPKKQQGMGEINRPHLGMELFEVDIRTGKAEPVKTDVTTLPKYRVPKNKRMAQLGLAVVQKEVHSKVTFDPNKFYTWAINKSNAEKKFRKEVKRARELQRHKQ